MRRSWIEENLIGFNFEEFISSGGVFLSFEIFNKLRRTFVPPISAIKTGYLSSI